MEENKQQEDFVVEFNEKINNEKNYKKRIRGMKINSSVERIYQ